MTDDQPGLFPVVEALPAGLEYRPGFISAEQEEALTQRLQRLPFQEFQFQGFLGKRRVVSFGMKYDFNEGGLKDAEEMPDFLLPLRSSAAAFAGVEADAMAQVLITEYAPGAGIGWHRDRRVFGDVVGISLLAPARLRFRKKAGEKWERLALRAEPRSAYLLRGPARSEWEHSIAPMEELRYSLTFRTLATAKS